MRAVLQADQLYRLICSFFSSHVACKHAAAYIGFPTYPSPCSSRTASLYKIWYTRAVLKLVHAIQ